jgi:hypothetical protein
VCCSLKGLKAIKTPDLGSDGVAGVWMQLNPQRLFIVVLKAENRLSVSQVSVKMTMSGLVAMSEFCQLFNFFNINGQSLTKLGGN